MGYITWTDSLVNGDNETATHITNMKNDITSIINGNIANSNVSGSAAIDESKIAFDITAGHNHDGANSRIISVGAYRAFDQGAWLNWVSAAEIKADSGVIDIGGTNFTRNSYSTTLDMTTAGHWVEGASQENSNQWVYVYAYNDSGTSWDIKFWLQPPQYANCGTDDSSVKIFRSNAGVWYRCLGAVWNNNSSDLRQFYQQGNEVYWDIPVYVIDGVSAGAWSAAYDVSTNAGTDVAAGDNNRGGIPALIGRIAYFNAFTSNGAGGGDLWIRMNGSTSNTAEANAVVWSENVGNEIGKKWVMVDATGNVNIRTATCASTAVYIEAYKLAIR